MANSNDETADHDEGYVRFGLRHFGYVIDSSFELSSFVIAPADPACR
jgi:hypothetical protein